MNLSDTLYYQNATTLAGALANKTISSVELLEQTIARINALDKHINAVVVRDFERALLSAKAADKALAKGKRLPLLGVPITVKESFNVEGLTTTWGNPQYKDWKPKADALTVKRLKDAGAIVIGKTNVPLMLRDWQTYNDLYGTTNNPWDLTLTPGGSSGGSAAALASGFVSLELGSDLAGSLRTPAHFCGVYAHKPTQDLIPTRGTSPPGTVPLPTGADLVTVGPLARSAADLALAFDVLSGPDEMLQGIGYQLKLPPARHDNLKDFRVLVLDTHPLYPTSDAVKTVVHAVSEELTRLGVQVALNDKHMPDLAVATQTYTKLMCAFIGVNFPDDIYEHFKTVSAQLDTQDTSLEAIRLSAFSSRFRDYFLAHRAREELRLAWLELMKRFDVIVCPVMPTEAFPHDESDIGSRVLQIDGQPNRYSDQFIWVSIATLLGFPATVVPIAQSKNGVPVGVQVIGSYLEDRTTLKFAACLAEVFAFDVADAQEKMYFN
ncbi:MAG: amidase [Legionellaceae bacterium]|nr:amidase [Legionellaceae bacterium]